MALHVSFAFILLASNSLALVWLTVSMPPSTWYNYRNVPIMGDPIPPRRSARIAAQTGTAEQVDSAKQADTAEQTLPRPHLQRTHSVPSAAHLQRTHSMPAAAHGL